ncbi:MAG: hypothetical protein FJ138_11040, partial [Deltaproteobacteria bacterium]|nr:hypothetical protein [Deltaproteobacteria bacterium]
MRSGRGGRAVLTGGLGAPRGLGGGGQGGEGAGAGCAGARCVARLTRLRAPRAPSRRGASADATTRTRQRHPMNILRYILFLCGQLGVMLLARFFFQWILSYSSQPLPAPDGGAAGALTLTLFSAAAVGAALLAFRVFDGVTDPIAGALSDAWVARGRERRALLWIAAPLPALGLALCFAPTPALSEAARWGLLLGGMFVFFVGYTVYAIPYWSLSGDYARSARESQLLSTLLGVGVLLATAVGFVVTPWLVEEWGYADAALLIAAVSVPLMVAPYFAAPAPAARAGAGAAGGGAG